MFNKTAYRFKPEVYEKVLRRLRNSSTSELQLWLDQTVNLLNLNMGEMKKSLSRGSSEEALYPIKDIREEAMAVVAATLVLEERFTGKIEL